MGTGLALGGAGPGRRRELWEDLGGNGSPLWVFSISPEGKDGRRHHGVSSGVQTGTGGEEILFRLSNEFVVLLIPALIMPIARQLG